MPACFNTNNASFFPQAGGVWLTGMGTADLREHSARYLVIGLINNMPDGALEATERQFLSLLDAASGHLQVRLLRYSLPGISRKGDAAGRVKMFYSGVEKLWNTCPDGLIVTGREPLATNLRDEPYWKAFTQVVEWARQNTYSTVWSCLAAHAAVLYTDDIVRRRSRTKHCGVFECSRSTEHPLTAGIGSQIQMPHSRWNGLSEFALRSHGYQVLTRSVDAGVDAFIKQEKSLFVYFQGHPEYEADTLMLEYRRDVARFLRGESKAYPTLPTGYFDSETIANLRSIEEDSIHKPRKELTAEVYEKLLTARTEARWKPAAVHIYKNWLEYISAQKQVHLQQGRIPGREHSRGRPMLVPMEAPVQVVANVRVGPAKGPRQGRSTISR